MLSFGPFRSVLLIAVHSPDLIALIDVLDIWKIGAGTAAKRSALTPRTDVVALDHLVERRRLDVEQLGRALLYAACRFERRLNQALLEVGNDLLQRDALGRDDELRHLETLA